MREIIIKTTCSKCGKVEEHTMPMMGEVINFILPVPYEWHRLDNDFICAEHIVGVMDKIVSKGVDK